MFTILIYLSLVCILFYLFEFISILSNQNQTKTVNQPNHNFNGISLIIPLRNEERNISSLIQTLSELEKPTLPFEIILVDDFSSDHTFSVLTQSAHSLENLTILKSNPPKGNLLGKANALHSAILISKYEIIAVTDADMSLNTKWLCSIENYFTKNSPFPDMVCGPTIVRPSSLWGTIQSLDWSFIMTVASLSFNAGNPLSAIGNNMIFRKSVYFEIGGYTEIPFTITEDFALFQRFISKGKHVLFPLEKSMLHITEPNKTILEFILQRKRWIKGGMSIPLRGKITLFAGIAGQLAILFALISSWVVFLFVVGIKITVDVKILTIFYEKMEKKFYPFYFILFEMFYFCSTLILPIIYLINPKVTWRERNF